MTKLIVLGDSILYGVTGFGAGHPRANPTIPQEIAIKTGWQVDNQAISATKYTNKTNNFTERVQQFNFANYDKVLIGYGINDFDDAPYVSPDEVRSAMKIGIDKIKKDNPNIKIYIELPTQSFVYGDSLSDTNPAGYSQSSIMDAIADCANSLGIPYYDWRSDPIITVANHQETLGDGQIHPIASVQKEMADVLAEWMQNTSVVNGKLQMIHSRDRLVSVANANFTKIFKALSIYAGSDQSVWEEKQFDKFGRSLYDYLAQTIRTISLLLSYASMELYDYDDQGNFNGSVQLKTPHSLLIDKTIDVLNYDFKLLEQVL